MVQELGTDEEITAVDQQLASGETIRTIEGPAAKVETLIREEQPSGGGSADGQSQPVATLMFRQGDRIVAVTGPSEVLHSLMSRVMVRQRP